MDIEKERKMYMKKYKCYYGLSGGFGGARDYEIIECESREQAEEIAWKLACEEYDSYSGMRGLPSWDEIAESEGLNPEEDEDTINAIFEDERESWLDFRAEEYVESEEEE